VIADGRTVTYDLGGTAGTREFADAIVERLGTASARQTDRAPVRAS
jgi:isocitrate/isopropylmalate dehydrogenase